MTRLHHTLDGDGPPIVFIHGFPLDHRMWAGQAQALAQKNYTCVTVDLSGFGRSLTDAPVHAVDDHAYDINELIDHLHLDKVHLVGLSMGGYVALAFARRYSHRLASLVLANTKARPDDDETRTARDKNIALIEQKGPGAFLDGFLPKLLSRKAPTALVAQIRAVAESQPQATLVAALLAMRDRPDATPVLKALDVPCLLLGSDADAVMPLTVVEEMKKVQPDADVAMLAGSGHLSALETPKQFNDALTKFFESLRH